MDSFKGHYSVYALQVGLGGSDCRGFGQTSKGVKVEASEQGHVV